MVSLQELKEQNNVSNTSKQKGALNETLLPMQKENLQASLLNLFGSTPYNFWKTSGSTRQKKGRSTASTSAND